jgi:hypothetical protein
MGCLVEDLAVIGIRTLTANSPSSCEGFALNGLARTMPAIRAVSRRTPVQYERGRQLRRPYSFNGARRNDFEHPLLQSIRRLGPLQLKPAHPDDLSRTVREPSRRFPDLQRFDGVHHAPPISVSGGKRGSGVQNSCSLFAMFSFVTGLFPGPVT